MSGPEEVIVRSVLVIDDDPFIRDLAAVALRRSGFVVNVAKDGREGLRMLEAQSVDLVVTDIFMPEADGLEVLRAIRRNRPEVGILAISGGSELLGDGYLEASQRLGADRIMRKPFNVSELVDAVRDMIAASAPPG